VKALCFEHFGGPEVLEYRELPDPVRGPGEILVRTRAIGLNFADLYRRRGNYHLAGKPPYIPGYEAAGIVEDPGTGPFRRGDRVAFADSPFANAELVAVPLEKLIPLPEHVSFEAAASLLLQGLTAQYLVRDSHPLRAGEEVLVHAAAGGVGLLLVQICKHLGARVMGMVSSETKREAALEAGADAVHRYDQDWPSAAKAFSRHGEGVDVAFDSVGSTLLESFQAVRRGGRVVFYGMAGGDPAPVDPRMLMDTSKSLTGGDLWNVLGDRTDRIRRATELFEWVEKGSLKLRLAGTFPLAQGQAAHTFLESRNAIGKVLLIP